jgi:hypothetical protein
MMINHILNSFGRRRLALATCVILLLIMQLQAHSQQLATASLGGTVVDPTGLSISLATVTLTNTAQGTVRAFTTEKDGGFSFTNLAAGEYVLAVHGVAGFSDFHQSLILAVGQSLQLSAKLSVERARTQIEVTSGATSEVDTVNSVDGGVIGEHQISNLPLNGRNYLELSLLVPGNSPAPNFDPTKVNTVVISSAGQVGRGSNVSIDGADNNDDVVGGSLVNIPEDAVQEFQIATNRFSAALGRSGSSVTNVVTRQGSNSIHGDAGVYERDKVLQGLPATYDPSIGATPAFHRQQYTGDVGGPIRHDKAWWFAAVEDRRQLGADLVGVRNTAKKTIGRTFATAPLHDFLSTERLDWQATERDRVGFNLKTISARANWTGRWEQRIIGRMRPIICKASWPIGFISSGLTWSTD